MASSLEKLVEHLYDDLDKYVFENDLSRTKTYYARKGCYPYAYADAIKHPTMCCLSLEQYSILSDGSTHIVNETRYTQHMQTRTTCL